MIKGSVNKRVKGETFLAAVTFESGAGAQGKLVKLLDDREPKAFTTYKRWVIYAQENADLSEVHAAINTSKKALLGKTSEGVRFLAVPFVRERLELALLRSAHTFRMLRTGIRLITNTHDLLNRHAENAPARVYKDD